jgi:pimeloyl-ACP methyl ester carboxylesterase
VTRDLRLLLSKLGLPPPYVLVGHSLGALHMMVLAAENPELAGALLLLDPPLHGRPVDMERRFRGGLQNHGPVRG